MAAAILHQPPPRPVSTWSSLAAATPTCTCCKCWAKMSIPTYVRVTVISNTRHTPYSGMLPGFLAGHYSHNEIHLDVGHLARCAGARLMVSEACGISYSRETGGGGFVQLADGRPPIRYDCLSIDIGSAPSSSITAVDDSAGMG